MGLIHEENVVKKISDENLEGRTTREVIIPVNEAGCYGYWNEEIRILKVVIPGYTSDDKKILYCPFYSKDN